MQIKDFVLLNRTLFVLKRIYWAWLGLCFGEWLLLVPVAKPFGMASWDKTLSNFFFFIFDGTSGFAFLLLSPYLLLVIFIIISIVQRKVSVWEFLAITITWGLMLYIPFPFRG